MATSDDAPIAAIVTAPGRGAVGIVRLSGTDLRPVISALCGQLLAPRHATYLALRDRDGAAIDYGIAIHFPAPHSYTGEDVLELQGHGGPVVLHLLLQRCLEAGASLGLRLAEPGEFTRRAFLNDKLDLAQAEAVADLIDASTASAARSASRSLSGAFSARIEELLAMLTELRMRVEAALDFPEEDIDILRQADVAGQLDGVLRTVASVQAEARQGVLLRDGMRIVIAGQPNAGKSSLLNALAGAELAIVSPIPGTTRDKVQQTLQIEGVPVHVIDTAGLRESTDIVEQMGVARAWAEVETADAILFLHDLSRLFPAADGQGPTSQEQQACRAADAAIGSDMERRRGPGTVILHVWNKTDTMPEGWHADHDEGLFVSARTGAGLPELRAALLRAAGWQPGNEGSFMARERHLQALNQVTFHMQAARLHLVTPQTPLDLLAEELRLAQNALARITGAFDADDLLGVIFSKFCIGK